MSQTPFSLEALTNASFIESLYQDFLRDPEKVESSWRYFFEGVHFGLQAQDKAEAVGDCHLRLHALITAYRTYGHLKAEFNAIALHSAAATDLLDLAHFGFSQQDLDKSFPTLGLLKEENAPLRLIIQTLEKIYCGKIGMEYMGLGNPELEKWVQMRVESSLDASLSSDEKIRILKDLNRAEIFETFIHTKYVGQKRFSLEGTETLIPMLVGLLEKGAEENITDLFLGMAHRGRLNVLANIFGKSYAYIFHEFEDHYTPDLFEGTGDVKYHKGFSATYKTHSGKEISILLSCNPSHLESVDAVVEGAARAKQELKKNQAKRKEVVPLLIHGDAAIAGQGVVYEVLQFEHLNGYGTCGTVHLVINNQIGFTTLPKDGRSTPYCTDIAKTFGAPVFHVHAEDPEGCVKMSQLALEIRQKFGCDVFIDLNGYRKYGHNESDEPAFTQPLEYQLIKSKKTIRHIYKERLIQEKVLDEPSAEELENAFKANLQVALEKGKELIEEKRTAFASSAPSKTANTYPIIDTRVDLQVLRSYLETLCEVPEGFHLNAKIERLLLERRGLLIKESNLAALDWSVAELLAYASICAQGVHVRLSGQDSRRGTFSHRHGVWIDQVNQAKYFPLSHVKEGQAPCDIFNSPLSEYAVLGFEFGYSLLYPSAIVIWEAQFGDFFNGAQIIVDQYLAASESKWGQKTNLTLLLPHGYEGQGPEHSSARIERFLQLSAEENMIIANCSTPAQFFHLLRRQALSPVKKPLVVFTPKALLRHPLCVSSFDDLALGSFQEIIDDPKPLQKARKLWLCSGKFYYELIQEREKREVNDVAIVRIEQLYPLRTEQLRALLAKYQQVEECIWVQEEHRNMGAWEFMQSQLVPLLDAKVPLRYVGRDRSASTATGFHALHKAQHAQLLDQLFK